jgi:hypothetical protein
VVLAGSPEVAGLAASVRTARDQIAIFSTVAHLLPPGTTAVALG